MQPFETIARLLRTDKDIVQNIALRVGQAGVLDGLVAALQQKLDDVRTALSVPRDADAKGAWDVLERKVAEHETILRTAMHMEGEWSVDSYRNILDFAYVHIKPHQGLFLKKEKATELIRNNPPQHIMQFLGYADVESFLQREDFLDIFCSLRFGEDREWLNTVFFKPYEQLAPDDFEQRDIALHVLSDKYAPLAQSFVQKKYHNLSHLKELGVLFIIPTQWHQPGQLMKIGTLAMHYLYEISFYADVVKQYAADTDSFAQKFISLLRGDVPEPKIDLASPDWLITQRYLEKEDPFEIGLMIPHVNPESLHWAKAQRAFAAVNPAFAVWDDTDWVGHMYGDGTGEENLVSFNLVDIAMSLADADKKKYTYHQREALWNKLFVSYFGEDALERKIKENIANGIIHVS